MASVSLAYGDLIALIDELDARIENLGAQTEEARCAGDAPRAALHVARCSHVRRLREYLEACAGNLAEQEARGVPAHAPDPDAGAVEPRA